MEWMELAEDISRLSTCLRRKVGAVIVKDGALTAFGYNSAPKDMEPCNKLGECIRDILKIQSGEKLELCRGIHAEMMAITQSLVDLHGAKIYITHAPCPVCAKLIIQAGIKEVIYREGYSDKSGIGYLKQGKVEVRRR